MSLLAILRSFGANYVISDLSRVQIWNLVVENPINNTVGVGGLWTPLCIAADSDYPISTSRKLRLKGQSETMGKFRVWRAQREDGRGEVEGEAAEEDVAEWDHVLLKKFQM